MRKIWIIAGIALVLIGLLGMTSQKWAFGKALPGFEKTWAFASGELRDLSVQSDYKVSLTFLKSATGENSLYLKGQGREKMIKDINKTELSGGKLNLDLREPQRKFIHFFDFGSYHAEEEIVVTLSDGAILDNLKLKLDSASLDVKDAEANNADIYMDSGSITIENLSAVKLIMKADSGSIKAKGIHADSTISADSGSMRLEGLTGPAKLAADSGSIKVYRDDTANTDIKADSGSVYVHLPASFAGFFDLQADSGSVSAPEPKRETKDFVKVRADSGSIKIEQG